MGLKQKKRKKRKTTTAALSCKLHALGNFRKPVLINNEGAVETKAIPNTKSQKRWGNRIENFKFIIDDEELTFNNYQKYIYVFFFRATVYIPLHFD